MSGADSDTHLRVGEVLEDSQVVGELWWRGEMGPCERVPRGVHEQDLGGEMPASLKDECWVRGGLGS